jgi:hypothetical protein
MAKKRSSSSHRTKPARARAAKHPPARAPTPARLLQLGMGFWGPRALLSAVELQVFTALAKGPLDAEQLRERLGVHPRAARDFFDTLVALGALERRGERYHNAADADLFLDRAKSSYVGGLLEMAAARLYPYWAALTEGLRTGRPQNETTHGGDNFATMYADPEKLRLFLTAMTGVSMVEAQAIAAKFPWKKYRTFVDVGAAQGCAPVQIALAHGHLSGGGFDLPPVQPIFEDYVRSFGLESRLSFHAGDVFRDPLPPADVLILGHMLHGWNLQEKHLLLQKAYAALPKRGALIVYDAMIDDARRHNLFGLLMSLNMLIETAGGFDYTPRDCRQWLKQTGFRTSKVVPLTPTRTMVVATK